MVDTLTAVTSILSQIGTILKWTWPFIILAWLFIYSKASKKWPMDVIILEKRGENLIKTNDRAGKFTDKYSGLIGYKLKKAKDTIPAINFDWIMHNSNKPTSIFEKLQSILRPTLGTVFLFRYGSKQYKPVDINDKTKDGEIKLEEMIDKEGKSIITYKYNQFDPRGHLGVLDFKVVDWDDVNFAFQEMRASIERRKKKGDFLKQIIIPAIAMGVGLIALIVMIKYGYDGMLAQQATCNQNSQTNTPATVPNIPLISDVLPAQ